MNLWIIAIVMIIVVGIILLSGKTSGLRKKTQEEYLKEFTKFVEGKCEPLPDYENSFRIIFDFEGRLFEFDGIEDKGLQETRYKAFLKTKTKSDLTVSLTEAPRATIRSTIVQASQISDQPIEAVVVPRELKQFSIFTNHVRELNALLADPKILDIFKHFKNTGPRGEPVMTLRIQDGWISLEFSSSVTIKPSWFELQQGVARIERYLDQMRILAKGVEGQFKQRPQQDA